MISDDIDYYTVDFQTSAGNVVSSAHLQQNGGYIIVPLWQQTTINGELKFQVKAWALAGDIVDKIAMTPLITRIIGKSVDGNAVLLNEEVGGLMAELQSLIANYPEKIVVERVEDLPETAADGTLATVREIEQSFSFLAIDLDTELNHFATSYLISASQPKVYFKPHPKKPNFTALGISEQVLFSGWTTVFGTINPYISISGIEYPHVHELLSLDLYDMIFVPAGEILPVDFILFNDLFSHRFDKTVNTSASKYLYIWDAFVDDNLGSFSVGWNLIDVDSEEEITALTLIDEMPPILSASNAYFDNTDVGLATKTYFSTVCSDEPFTNRTYVMDDGEWKLNAFGGTTVIDGEDGTDGTSWQIGDSPTYYWEYSNDGGVTWTATTISASGGSSAGAITIDQTMPQTFTGGIPLLPSTETIDSDYQLVHKKYVDENSGSVPIVAYTNALYIGKSHTLTTGDNTTFTLPTVSNPAVLNQFRIEIKATSAISVTWTGGNLRAGGVAYVYGVGAHVVIGTWSTIQEKWLLDAQIYGGV